MNPPQLRRGNARCPRARRAATTLCLALLVLALSASVTQAYVYTDIIDFNLTETTSTYGMYSISSVGDNSAYYRWVDDPNHSTTISGNNCADLSLYGKADIPAHNTSYFKLFTGSPYLCFALRGRTAPGAGSMTDHDGRIQR